MDMDEGNDKEEQLEHEDKSQVMDENKSGQLCLDCEMLSGYRYSLRCFQWKIKLKTKNQFPGVGH